MGIFRCDDAQHRSMMTYNTPPMFVDYRQEKLRNAIIYFSRNTKFCYTLKLYKLLYFLDFEHYRQTGWSVTGLDYHAFPKGPVPPALHEEVKADSSILGVKEIPNEMTETIRREFKPEGKFDSTYFTPRELEIMERLALFFKDAKSNDMSTYSHSPKLPWKKIYGKGEGIGRIIPYELALQSEPIVHDKPTIEEEDLAMWDDLYAGTGLR